MGKTTDSVVFSETQREVLETALQNPTLTNAEIAEKTGTRIALVRDVLDEYGDEVELATAESNGQGGDEPSEPADETLSETQQAIVDATEADPTLTNAEIAEQTGARIALVRDTRNEHGVDVKPTDSGFESANGASTADSETALTEGQKAILETAREDPTLTNAEVAEQTGTRIALVRDTRNEHEADAEAGASGPTADSDPTGEADGGSNTTQQEILAVAAENPELTNAEIAEKTGARIALVRDTRADAETDADDSAGSTASQSEVDADTPTGTKQEVLALAKSNPELTNADIAEQTGAHVALVRDIRDGRDGSVTPDETTASKQAGSETADSDADANEDEDGSTTADTDSAGGDSTANTDDDEPGDEDITTETGPAGDGDPSSVQQTILQAAAENSALTNAEIAEKTGTRVALVRDTREAYEADTGSSAGKSDVTIAVDEPGEPSERQQAILDTAAENPELTNKQIAEQVGARITLVRDTRATYDAAEAGTESPAETETNELISEAESAEPADTDETDDVGDGESAATTEEPTEPEGINPSGILIIALLLLALLLAVVFQIV